MLELIPDHIQRKVSTLEIVLAQQMRLLDKETLLQVTFMHPDQGVKDEEEITKVVQHQPRDRKKTVQLPEDSSSDHKDQVVEHGEVYDPQPIVMIRFPRIYDKFKPTDPTTSDLQN